MGDDLGDEWDAQLSGAGSDDEEAITASTSKKKPFASAGGPTNGGSKVSGRSASLADAHGHDGGSGAAGGGGGGGGGGGAKRSGRKRGRVELDAEGFEDDSGLRLGESSEEEQEGTGRREDDGGTLIAAAEAAEGDEEDEAKRKKAEKKRQKLKDLKARTKERKRKKTASDATTPAAEGVSASQARVANSRDSSVAAVEASQLWAAFCKVRGDLVTPLELDDPWIKPESLACVDGFGAHTTPKLVGFIKASLVDWKKRIQNRNINAPRGSPSVVIMCSGARRCVEVMKNLTAFRCQVVKLFAKHLKLEEQKVMLKKGCFPLAVRNIVRSRPGAMKLHRLVEWTMGPHFPAPQVGTPGRMRALAVCGSLRLDSCALLVLDTDKNVKGRTVLDMDGVKEDAMTFLAEHARPFLASAVRPPKSSKGGQKQHAKGQLRIALY